MEKDYYCGISELQQILIENIFYSNHPLVLTKSTIVAFTTVSL
ncbi:hypothetical protein [Lysinibacillus sp. 38-6]